ncbi:ferredoxin [Halorientalis brevis]|uniref:Ferredoxin n=1 Tax=Halorientalis brevis TaxID=1126241 RepID=A0ABD6CGS0_9EURY|nr:ferredoxin [Halorientalis brevis]
MYEVTIDRDACDGVFACLVRDGRFVEADDGTATIDEDADAVTERRTEADEVTVSFEGDDMVDDARQAAAACPLDAITVEES